MDQQQGNMAPPGGGNKKIVWIIIAILLILGIGWYFMSRGTKNQTKSGNESAESKNQENAAAQESLKELMASGKSQKCEVSFKSGDTESQGKIFVGNGKMRASFTATVAGKQITSNMLNDGQTVYSWMEGQTTGFKMTPEAMEKPSGSEESSRQAVDVNAKYNYNCTANSVDNTTFAVPSGVTFTDMSAIIQGSGTSAGASASMKAQQCAACDQAGTGKAQCLAALNC